MTRVTLISHWLIQRPKNIQQWSVVDVQKWLRRHCGDYYHLYAESFLEQEVSCLLLVSLLTLHNSGSGHRQMSGQNEWKQFDEARNNSPGAQVSNHHLHTSHVYTFVLTADNLSGGRSPSWGCGPLSSTCGTRSGDWPPMPRWSNSERRQGRGISKHFIS